MYEEVPHYEDVPVSNGPPPSGCVPGGSGYERRSRGGPGKSPRVHPGTADMDTDRTVPYNKKPPPHINKPYADVSVVVNNVPPIVKEEEIGVIFQKFGRVWDVFLNYQRGLAIVRYDNAGSVHQAVQHMSGQTIFNSRKLRCTMLAHYRGSLDHSPFSEKLTTAGRHENVGSNRTKAMEGRKRLFVGNLTPEFTEEKIKEAFEKFGQVVEIFLSPEKSFALLKMESHKAAEDARVALDNTSHYGKLIQVRYAMQGCVLKISHMPNNISNELLEASFAPFGEIERAVVVVDDRGRPTGTGIVEFATKKAASQAFERCRDGALLVTASPQPIQAQFMDYEDMDIGLPERILNKSNRSFVLDRDLGPRFSCRSQPQEYDLALKWKQFYIYQDGLREQAEKQIEIRRRELEIEMDLYRREQERFFAMATQNTPQYARRYGPGGSSNSHSNKRGGGSGSGGHPGSHSHRMNNDDSMEQDAENGTDNTAGGSQTTGGGGGGGDGTSNVVQHDGQQYQDGV